MKDAFQIAFWNYRKIKPGIQPGRINNVMRVHDKYRVDLAALSETRIPQFGTLDCQKYNVLYSEKERIKEAGLVWEPFKDRILRARFATTQAKMRGIAVHALTNESSGL